MNFLLEMIEIFLLFSTELGLKLSATNGSKEDFNFSNFLELTIC